MSYGFYKTFSIKIVEYTLGYSNVAKFWSFVSLIDQTVHKIYLVNVFDVKNMPKKKLKKSQSSASGQKGPMWSKSPDGKFSLVIDSKKSNAASKPHSFDSNNNKVIWRSILKSLVKHICHHKNYVSNSLNLPVCTWKKNLVFAIISNDISIFPVEVYFEAKNFIIFKTNFTEWTVFSSFWSLHSFQNCTNSLHYSFELIIVYLFNDSENIHHYINCTSKDDSEI